MDQLSLSYSLGAGYALSPKTRLTAAFSQSFDLASDNRSQDISSFNASASALWKYSAKTEIGPGIRLTRRSGDTGNDLTSIGPTLTANYRLAEKVSLNSTIGMDFNQYDEGENPDPSVFAAISLGYRASPLWSMNLSLNRDSTASYSSVGQFEEVTGLRLGYSRNIRRLTWNLGCSLENRTSDNPDPNGPTSPDRDYFSIDSSLSTRIFKGTTAASVFVRFSDEAGGRDNTWNSFQTGFSLSRSF